jgi:hypothetical protein
MNLLLARRLLVTGRHMHPGDDAKISESVEDLSSWHLPGEHPSLRTSHPGQDDEPGLARPWVHVLDEDLEVEVGVVEVEFRSRRVWGP